MRGYVRLNIDGQEFIIPNELMRYEASRAFRVLVGGSTLPASTIYGDFLLRGEHSYDVISGAMPYAESYYQFRLNSSMSPLSTTGEVMRYRRKVNVTNAAPAQPGQIAYAQGRIAAIIALTPASVISTTDINLKQIGNVFGHPAGRHALFNETAIVPVGVGNVFSSGTLDFSTGSGPLGDASSGSNTGEEGSYIYSIRIANSGGMNGSPLDAKYFWQRRPYYVGAFEPGDADADDFTGAETLGSRWSLNNTRGSVSVASIIPDTASPTPSQVPYQVQYPTQTAITANVSSIIKGMAFDYLPAYSASIAPFNKTSNKIWWCVSDVVANNNVNASTSRSLWSWKRFTNEAPRRRDASDGLGNPQPLTAFPSLDSNVMFRDLRAGRGGYLYLAADGDDDSSSTNASDGALIMIDASSGSVRMVAGAVSGSIYTSGGLQHNNVLAVTVDRSGLRTALSRYDRVWTLHRNGLSFFDVDTNTGAIVGAISTVGSGTSTFNTIDGNSIRGLSGFTPRGNGGIIHNHGALLGTDNKGDVYWVSCPTGKNYSNSIHRLNKLTGDASTHTCYVLHTSAQDGFGSQAYTGTMGYILLGGAAIATAGVSGTINTLKMFKTDNGDPNDGRLWLATGQGTLQSAVKVIASIATGSWLSGNNDPGAGYFGDTFGNSSTALVFTAQLAPDDSVWVGNSNTGIGLLESLGRVVSGSGATGALSNPALSGSTYVQNLYSPNAGFVARQKQKRIQLTNTSMPINSGSFLVSGVIDSQNITIFNSGTFESSSFNWQFAGTEFDTQTTTAGATGSWTNSNVSLLFGYNWFVDESGVGYAFTPRNSGLGAHQLIFSTPITYQWSTGSNVWFRRRASTMDAAAQKFVHRTADDLTNGVKVAFATGGTGPTEYIRGEYYTWGASHGLIKDPTQQIQWGYDLFYQKTDLIVKPMSESNATWTASQITPRFGFLDNRSLASVTTDNPFILTTSASIQGASYQRRLLLDGTNNTQNVTSSGNPTTTSGWQAAIDFGADTIASKLKVCLGNPVGSPFFSNLKIDLYSSTAASGPSSWTLRNTFSMATDCPAWTMQLDAFRNNINATLGTAAEFTVDLGYLDGSGSFGSNTAQRYWKMALYASTSTVATVVNFNGMVGFDSQGKPIGISENNRLSTSTDTNYMANYVIRCVWVQQGPVASTLQPGPAINQVQLSAGTFDTTKVQANDYIRVLDGSNNVLQELKISNVTSTIITVTTPVTLGFSNATWEIVRNAVIRPRDDEGGGEDQAVFPPSGGPGVGQVFICPVTGFIMYNDEDITAGRQFRRERYVKVKREL